MSCVQITACTSCVVISGESQVGRTHQGTKHSLRKNVPRAGEKSLQVTWQSSPLSNIYCDMSSVRYEGTEPHVLVRRSFGGRLDTRCHYNYTDWSSGEFLLYWRLNIAVIIQYHPNISGELLQDDYCHYN